MNLFGEAFAKKFGTAPVLFSGLVENRSVTAGQFVAMPLRLLRVRDPIHQVLERHVLRLHNDDLAANAWIRRQLDSRLSRDVFKDVLDFRPVCGYGYVRVRS